MDENKADPAQVTRIDTLTAVPSQAAAMTIVPPAKPQAAIAAAPEKNAGKEQLFVGPGLKLKLEVGQCDIFRCEGEAEGNVKARQLVLASSGVLAGHVEVESADIEGSFDGIMIVAGLLHVRSTGRMSGNIRYKEIEIERGGQVQGQMSAMDANIAAIAAAGSPKSSTADSSAGDPVASGTPAAAEAKKLRRGIFGKV